MKPSPAIVRAGFRRDTRQMRAALLVWAITVVIALASILPAWRWWSEALASAPRGDVLIDRIDLVTLKELVQFDRASAFAMVRAGLGAGVLLAVLLNPFFAGGVLTLLMSEPARRFATRFAEGGVRYYGRFLRALLYLGVAAIVILGLVAAGFTLAIDAVSTRGFERLMLALTVVQGVVLMAIAAWFTAALDLARIKLMREDSSRALAESLRGLGLAARHLVALARVGLVYLALLIVLTTAVVFVRSALPGGGWGWLVVAVVVQQGLAYGRLRLRVAAMASCVALVPALPTPVEIVPVAEPIAISVAPETTSKPEEEPNPIGVGH